MQPYDSKTNIVLKLNAASVLVNSNTEAALF